MEAMTVDPQDYAILLNIFGAEHMDALPTITNSNELLELAAKALGASFAVIDGRRMRSLGRDPDTGEVEFVDWDPLTDYGDAFHLAVALKLEIDHRECGGRWGVHVGESLLGLSETFEYDADPHGATCEAIVWTAAEIGSRPLVVQMGMLRK